MASDAEDNVDETASDPAAPTLKATLVRALKIAVIGLGLLVAGIAIVSLLSEDDRDMPFQYEGFD